MFELPPWLSALLTGIGGLGAGTYVAVRKLRHDTNSDLLDAKARGIIDKLDAQLDAERKNSATMSDTIDRVAKERNHAVQQVGRLEGTVQALQTEVEHMRKEVVTLEGKNDNLTRQISSLNEHVSDLSKKIHDMLTQFSMKVDPRS